MLTQSRKVDVNLKCRGGKTALHVAARTGNCETIRILFTRDDINVNVQDNDRMTPLHYATCCERMKAVAMLLNHPDIMPNILDGEGKSALAFALYMHNLPLVTMFIADPEVNVDIERINNTDLLHNFASSGDVDAVIGLLMRGFTVDRFDTNGVCFWFIERSCQSRWQMGT